MCSSWLKCATLKLWSYSFIEVVIIMMGPDCTLCFLQAFKRLQNWIKKCVSLKRGWQSGTSFLGSKMLSSKSKRGAVLLSLLYYRLFFSIKLKKKKRNVTSIDYRYKNRQDFVSSKPSNCHSISATINCTFVFSSRKKAKCLFLQWVIVRLICVELFSSSVLRERMTNRIVQQKQWQEPKRNCKYVQTKQLCAIIQKVQQSWKLWAFPPFNAARQILCLTSRKPPTKYPKLAQGRPEQKMLWKQMYYDFSLPARLAVLVL